MRSIQPGLLFLLAAVPSAFGARRAGPLRSFGRSVAVQDGWVQGASGMVTPMGFKPNVLSVVKQEEPSEPEEPVEEEEEDEDEEEQEEMAEIIDEEAPEPAEPVDDIDEVVDNEDPPEVPSEPVVPDPVIDQPDVPGPPEEEEPKNGNDADEDEEVEEPAPEEEEEEEETPAPSTKPANPNDVIAGVTWSGTGCPNGPDSDDPSVSVIIEEESDFSAFFMEQFGVSMGLEGAYGPKQQFCELVFDVVDVPSGWRFGFMDSRAEGNIYLEKGSIANFTTEIWWGDMEAAEVKAYNMKYWPNLDKDDPVNVRYMTTPYMLNEQTMAPYASECPADGETFSGKMSIKFTLTMTPGDAEADVEARGLVDMLAVGITNRVIPC